MGRIKPRMVKNTSKTLMADENQFTEDFDHNKKLLGNLMPSKKIRNKIAGYLARLVRQKAEAKKNFKPRQFVSEESKEEVQ